MNGILRRRRALMGKATKVDTTPVIAETGYYLNPSSNSKTASANWGYTKKYKVPSWVKNVDVYQIKCAKQDHGNVGIHAYTTTENNYSTAYSIVTTRTINVNYTFSKVWLEFSIYLPDMKDTYAYNATSGEILFAGENTLYYGKTNINY